jgi:hypothetical protein
MNIRRTYILIVLFVMSITNVVAQFPMGGMNGGNSASAPSFVQPQAYESGYGWLETEFPAMNAQFVWTPPVANNAPTVRFQYDLTIKRVVPGQEVVDAAQYGTVAFQQRGLMTNVCMIPQNVVETLKNSGTEYFVAQVIARPIGANVTMTNNGKSEIMLLHFKQEKEQCLVDSVGNK